MSYEINVIVMEQVKPVQLNFKSIILLENEIDEKYFNRYCKIWPFFSSIKGIEYSLVTEIAEDYYCALKICDADFDKHIKNNEVFCWLSETDRENLNPFIVNDKYWKDFIQILEYLLDNAPQNRILFHTRYEGGDTEIVCGVVKFNTFINMIYRKQVLFNVCYIVEKD